MGCLFKASLDGFAGPRQHFNSWPRTKVLGPPGATTKQETRSRSIK